MAMRWRVSASEWKPNQMTMLDRTGAKRVDKEENRRHLTAYEMNAQIGVRGCWHLINELSQDIERQAKHVGVWPRWKACVAQMRNMQMQMLDKVSLEQLISVKNNSQHMRIAMTPQLMPGEPEKTIQTMKDHNRLLCASLCYCQQHCDGSAQNQYKCPIKRLLDQSCYIQECDFPQLLGGTCRYNMVDMDWDSIRRE